MFIFLIPYSLCPMPYALLPINMQFEIVTPWAGSNGEKSCILRS